MAHVVFTTSNFLDYYILHVNWIYWLASAFGAFGIARRTPRLPYNNGVADTTRDRITRNPAIMGGKPCIRGMRVTVGTIVGLVASGHPWSEILNAYPYLEEDDIRQALRYRVDEPQASGVDFRNG